MSDPVSKSEIEDVLASIRRLVSVDDRAAQSSTAHAPMREEDKLILTPSQRVDERGSHAEDVLEFVDGEVEPEGDELAEAEEADAGGSPGDSRSDGDDWDAPEDSFEAAEEDLEPEEAAFEAEEEALDAETEGSDTDGEEEAGFSGHDPFEQEEPDGGVITHRFRTQDAQADDAKADDAEADDAVPDDAKAEDAKPDDARDEDAEVEEAQADETGADAPEAEAEAVVAEAAEELDEATEDAVAKLSFQHTPRNALEARIAEVEAAVAARDDDWEPDGSMDDEMSASKVPSMEWQDEPADAGAEVEDAEVIDAVVDAVEDDAGEETVDDTRAAGDPEPVSQAEPVAAPDTEPEPVDEAEPAAADAADEVFEAEAETEDELREAETAAAMQEEVSARAEAEDEADDAGLWSGDDEGFLDEDALRDMVSEIVRQELQGALGERITRNVRKLVRREIHRALMSQGIE